METELKSCPFCGGEASDTGHIRYSRALRDTWWDDGAPVTEAFFVNCVKCGAQSRAGLVGGYQTKDEAIAAWNTRATQAPLIAALREGVEAFGRLSQACSGEVEEVFGFEIGSELKQARTALTTMRDTLAKIEGEGA